ncbi:MAG: AAA domain-containing protein [Clostridiaceae bacterium]|nr:AAA domain-containing protein [Clostridiaceae bacterium]
MVELDKNLILYGPPGTGKTYSAIQYAVAIIEEKAIGDILEEEYSDIFARYRKYREDALVEFTTFHQSYGYEEFIEGIRPVVTSEEEGNSKGEIRYEIRDGVFKSFCDKAGSPVGSAKDIDLGIGKSPTVWKVSLGGTGKNECRSECLEFNHIRIGWDKYGEVLTDETDYSMEGGKLVLNAFYNNMQIGDLVLSCASSRTIDAIGVVTGDPEWHDEYDQYKRLRKVRWLVKGINEDIVDLNAGRGMTLPTVYKLSVSVTDAIDILRRVNPSLFTAGMKVPNRVFIIDEINRGNISKIFGELITLIEPTKRLGEKEAQRSALPYSGHKFGVPENVYIIGTMNTADRSIAMIDTALRRRFGFIEMQPDPGTLEGTVVEDIDIAVLLETMNKRITVLHDREHTIGHSYLLPLKDDPSMENLARIFKNKIIPLLQEYFYDDYEKIWMVLGDNRKTQEPQFIIKKNDVQALFGNSEMDLDDYFEINDEAFMKVEAYAFLQ